MAFLRFSRDRRGYEHFYLVQPYSTRPGRVRQHILYWFRTPPNVKVGREPFAAHVQRALEAEHPDIGFDWNALTLPPLPPPDTDRWRERRRTLRASKQAPKAELPAGEPELDLREDEPAMTATASIPGESVPDGAGEASVAVSAPEVFEKTREPETLPPSLGLRRRRRRGRRTPRRGDQAMRAAGKPEGE